MSSVTSAQSAAIDVSDLDVKTLIPHREPFLLIDGLEDYQPGESLTAVKLVREDEFWVAGHFPEFPVMPGVLVVEALAQTCAAFMALGQAQKDARSDLYVLLKTNVRYPKPVLPGVRLQLTVQLDIASDALHVFKVKAFHGKTVCVRGELAVGIAPREKVIPA
ncbi:3-hydroxyacyl-ACP dehydratase FabZ family protein [Photobacterium sp. 1_MG-2023]|uniref:3-hydroxyacyl-ACP dehydratase FabZ family protein n=1 Tax=Photobacterium sp. 1_MG-2023 TaxID=3062646 RepID=UPI0026E13CE7|nr:3-hydroxyacyl-ACP dehydratase FabZ family protein [Photobacterium sp. 1_MG-2023]MDO6708145.1 3-hydroxyacyl-ACP dehydratase FabZ family protein [Photobacterium sp. 1_MG-2023]